MSGQWKHPARKVREDWYPSAHHPQVVQGAIEDAKPVGRILDQRGQVLREVYPPEPERRRVGYLPPDPPPSSPFQENQ